MRTHGRPVRQTPSRSTSILLLALVAAGITASDRAVLAQGVQFPADANIRSVLAFGAVPNDGLDDTAAFQAALNATVGQNVILYVPDGVYNLSDRLNWGGVAGGNFVSLQGQSQSGTILKLADNAPGFDGAGGATKAFIDAYEGNTANAFRNYLQDMTIDVGSGNPGVIGVQFQSNNTGRIQNLTIRSTGPGRRGAVGLDIAFEFPGPFLAQNITIEGFDTGIRGAPQEYSVTFEHLTLRRQNTLGIYVWRLPLQIRDLVSVNSVPVLSSDTNPGAWGHVVIDGGSFTGGSPANDAIIAKESAGVLALRNIATQGYRFAVNDLSAVPPTTRPDGPLAQYSTQAPTSLFPSPTEILPLPVEDAPAAPAIPLSQWASVKAFGAVENDNLDDTRAIQAAMRSGASVVYFPTGTYYVSDTIEIGPAVVRIEGLKSDLVINSPLAIEPKGALRIGPGSAAVVHITGLNASFQSASFPVGGAWIVHAAPNTLVLRDGDLPAYRNTVSGGRVFLENIVGNRMEFIGQRVWARQLNPEGFGFTNVINQGGDFYCLGLKTEGVGTVLETRAGGRSVVLGGLVYPATVIADRTLPMFVSRESSLSFTVPESCYVTDGNFAVWCRETRGGVTNELPSSALSRGHSVCGRMLALYNGYRADPTPPSTPPAPTISAASFDRISLAWPASSDLETGIARYNVYRDGAFLRSVMTPALVDDGQPDGAAHAYAVSAINGAGLESARSASTLAHTEADATPPRLLSASTGLDPRVVTLVFSEPVTGADIAANYRIDGPAPVSVLSAALAPDGRTVSLAVTAMSPGLQILTVSGLADRASTPNPIAPSTRATFIYSPASAGTGLSGAYYADREFRTAPLLTRVDPQIDFNYGLNSPGPGVPADNFAVRWTGQIRPRFTETYTIFIRSDDGARVFIDGRLLINEWVDQGPTEVSAQVSLDSARTHDIVVEYYEGGATAEVRLSWSSASQPKQVIPATHLFPTPRLTSVRTGFGAGADANLIRFDAADHGAEEAFGPFHSPASGGFHSAGYFRFDLAQFALQANFIDEGLLTLSQTYFGVGDGRRQLNVFGVRDAAGADGWIESGSGHVTWDSAAGNDNSGGQANGAAARFVSTILLDNTGFQNNNQPDKVAVSGSRLLDFLAEDADAKATFLIKRVDASNEGQSFFTKEWSSPSFAPALRLRVLPKCPVVLAQPALASAQPGDNLTIFATVQGQGPLSFQWFRDGLPLVDGQSAGGSSFAGATSPALTILNARGSVNGAYVLVAANACGAASTAPIALNLPTCPADFNADGLLDPDDLADYIGCFFAVLPCAAADYNADGFADPDDLSDYIAAFFAGC